MTGVPGNNLDARDAHHRIKNSLQWLGSLLKLTRGTGLVTTSYGRPPVSADHEKRGSPQFPGLEFNERFIELNDLAASNDAAIRASLIYFKHTWPNRPAIFTGSLAFRVRAWEMAQEFGVPVQGPHPLASNLPVRFRSERRADATSPPALESQGRRRLAGPR